jgi:hypothetical protein
MTSSVGVSYEHATKIKDEIAKYMAVLSSTDFCELSLQTYQEEFVCLDPNVWGRYKPYLALKLREDHRNMWEPNFFHIVFSVLARGGIGVTLWQQRYDPNNHVEYTDFGSETYTIGYAYRSTNIDFVYMDNDSMHTKAYTVLDNYYKEFTYQLLEIITKMEDKFGIPIVYRIK